MCIRTPGHHCIDSVKGSTPQFATKPPHKTRIRLPFWKIGSCEHNSGGNETEYINRKINGRLQNNTNCNGVQCVNFTVVSHILYIAYTRDKLIRYMNQVKPAVGSSISFHFGWTGLILISWRCHHSAELVFYFTSISVYQHRRLRQIL